MNEYPQPLADLIGRNYNLGDFRVLVEQSGGNWGQVQQSQKKDTALHYALGYLCRDPAKVVALRSVVRKAGYMNDTVSLSIDDFVLRSLQSPSVPRPLTVPPDVVADATDLVSTLYPTKADVMALGTRAGLTPEQTELAWWYADDHHGSVVGILIVAALSKRLRAVIQHLATEHPDDANVRALNLRLESAQAEQEPTRPTDTNLRDDGGQEVGRHDAASKLQSKPSKHQLGRSSQPARRDLPREMRGAVRRSALQALEHLHELMDEALANFAREDADGALQRVAADVTLNDCTDAIYGLLDHIDNYSDAETNEMLADLALLIANVLRGVDLAEAEEDFGAVADLSEEAAGAYETVAGRIGGDTGTMLDRVVPYWRMKATHARHEHKVSRQQRRLAATSTSATTRNRTRASSARTTVQEASND